MFWTVLAIVLIVAFVALIAWFATHRDRNGMDNAPEGAQSNPPVNGTGLYT